MAQVLKMLQLPQQNRVAEMEIGCGRVKARFHAQRAAGFRSLHEALAQIFLTDDFGGALGDVLQLFVEGHFSLLDRIGAGRRG